MNNNNVIRVLNAAFDESELQKIKKIFPCCDNFISDFLVFDNKLFAKEFEHDIMTFYISKNSLCNLDLIHDIKKQCSKPVVIISSETFTNDTNDIPVYIFDNHSNLTSFLTKENEIFKLKNKIAALKKEKDKFREESILLKDRFQKFQDVSLLGYFVLGTIFNEKKEITDFNINYINNTASNIFNISPQNVEKKTLKEILPEDAKQVFNIIKDVYNSTKSIDIEIALNVQKKWYRILAVKINEDVSVSFIDITLIKKEEKERTLLLEREKKAKALAENAFKQLIYAKEEYRIMGETIPFGVWKASPSGEVLYASASFLKLLNMSLSEINKKGWYNILSRHQSGALIKSWLQGVKLGREIEVELEYVDCNNKKFNILTKGLPLKDQKGNISAYVGINLDITNRKEIEKKLESLYTEQHKMLERISDAFLALDVNWNVTYMNHEALKLGDGNKTIIGKNYQEAFPFMSNSICSEKFHNAMNKQIPEIFEMQGIEIDDWLQVSAYPSTEGLTVFIKDITAQKVAQEKLNQTLKDKEILIKEIHHRVKNNLQIISSLLSLQANYITDPKALDSFKDSQNRIRTMALVHEQLYQRKNLSHINFKDYIRELIQRLFASYENNSKVIKVNIIADELELDIEDSINLGLIINELVLNSLKHAFKIKTCGLISVIIKKNENHLNLVVEDDGDGFPENIEIDKTDSFGLQLLNALTIQMNGSLNLIRENGTKFIVDVKIKEVQD